MLDRDDAVVLGGMREHLLAVDIADRVDPLDVRAHHRIDRDKSLLVGLDADLFQADVLDDWFAADGDHQ